MLKYLIIQLDDVSTSFCHYSNDRKRSNLISLEILKEGIFWSMKENLTLQVLYPDYEIPEEYKAEIEKTFHADIVSSTCEDTELREKADVVVFSAFEGVNNYPFNKEQSFVFRTTMQELFDNSGMLDSILQVVNRINIVITDVSSFKKEDEALYTAYLNALSDKIVNEYKSGHSIQVNLLTDRILLDGMNNCNAGEETITLCPDGNFYICPAFYSDDNLKYAVGSPKEGLDIKNAQLYRISHAPICRICDAYQCKRCVWLNKKTTLEVNTPSREQCVMAHLERNASRGLLAKIREHGTFLPDKSITEINYTDPFQLIVNNE